MVETLMDVKKIRFENLTVKDREHYKTPEKGLGMLETWQVDDKLERRFVVVPKGSIRDYILGLGEFNPDKEEEKE